MSNPFVRGSLTDLSLKSNMTSLGDGEAKVIAYFDLSSQIFKDVEIAPIQFRLGTGSFDAGTLVEAYIAISENTTDNFTDAIDYTSNADQASLIAECTLAETVEATVASTLYTLDGFSVAQKLGRSSMPSHVAILLKNAAASVTEDFSASAVEFIANGRTITFA